jgi:hypothetical protein
MKKLWALMMMLGVLAACVPAGSTQVEVTQADPTPAAAIVTATQIPEIAVPTAEPTHQPMDPATAASLLQERCGICHSLDRVNNASKSFAEWTVTIQRMVQHGAILTADEETGLVAYLATIQP